MYLIPISLIAFIAVSTASQIESGNSAFIDAGSHGCISALVLDGDTNGAPVVAWNCHSNDDPTVPQDWDTKFGYREQIKILGNKCLDVTDGVDADGTKLQLWDCDDQNMNQKWTYNTMTYNFEWSGGSNKCIDLTDGNVGNGNQLQIWTCDPWNNRNQRWFKYPGTYPSPGQGTLLEAGTPGSHMRAFAMFATQNQDHAALALVDLTSPSPYPGGNGTWTVPPLGEVGPIATYGGSKCLAVRGANVPNGDSLDLVTCNGGATQLWKVDGFGPARSISWAGGNRCVAQDTKVWDCNPDDRNQWWIL